MATTRLVSGQRTGHRFRIELTHETNQHGPARVNHDKEGEPQPETFQQMLSWGRQVRGWKLERGEKGKSESHSVVSDSLGHRGL